ncbi:TPA: 50S ribosomal protein L5 [Candidatus Bathyarchaeota archaeon]|nr:50S ribosomal protein L5 [Candidatus Bathyarchaeota archaeon]
MSRQQNPMLAPRIHKVVVNMAVGRSGEPLENAMKVLEQLTGQRPCVRRAKRTIKTFGITRGEPIACLVTLRGKRAESFLERALQAVGNRLPVDSFDKQGNVAFGIREHIEIPGVKYDPTLGIHGMDVCISFERPGYRVMRRRRERARIGSRHRLTPEEVMLFLKERFGVEILHGKAKAS